MSTASDILKGIAPLLANALLPGIGPVVSIAENFLASKLGVPPEQVQQTIAGMQPADLLKMKEMDLAFKQHLDDNGIQLQLAQVAVNQEQAKSTSFFIAGPRPAVMWVCVIALALVYWPKAIVLCFIWAWQAGHIILTAQDIAHAVIPAYPDLGVTDLLGLLSSILGLGGMRTAEKITNSEGNR